MAVKKAKKTARSTRSTSRTSRSRSTPSPRRTRADASGSTGSVPITIVGVGASAGGLEAFSQLLRGIPERPGIALIFVQHLAPTHESALVTLLSAQTLLPVLQVNEGTRV